MQHLLIPDSTGYGRLVRDGHYADAPSGLHGKYDNVRRFWENQISRFAVQPALARLVAGLRARGRGMRVVDLGCGSGEGWDLLAKVGGEDGAERYLLAPGDIAAYHGIDLCPAMVAQCAERFRSQPEASFAVGDLNDLDGNLAGQEAFDLYYDSYGSLSHLDDEGLGRLVGAVMRHQDGRLVLVIDVHGQYSQEWPRYWDYSRDPQQPRMQPYNMVWMYPAHEREARLEEQRDYRVRYWRGEELRSRLMEIPGFAARLDRLTLCDRSLLVGRHLATGCFGAPMWPFRQEVNALFEFNQVAEAGRLVIPELPTPPDAEVAAFLARFRRGWNALVAWFAELLVQRGEVPPIALCEDDGPIPPALRDGMWSLARQSRNLSWFRPGDPEANLLQPQFALLLRQYEFHAQRGLGCGHGLIAVAELAPAGGR